MIDESQTVEGDLRREIAMNIKRLQEIDAIEAFVTEKVFQFVDRRQRQTLEHVKVQSVLSQIRRNNR